jgi:hypothetical protein
MNCGARPAGDTSELIVELREWVSRELGAIAKPEEIRFADNLPKTRSGKIMRRLLRALARGEEINQDVSKLENPAIIAQLRGIEATAAPAARAHNRRQPARRARPAKAKKTAARKPTVRRAARRSKKKRVATKSTVKKSALPKRSVRKPMGRKRVRAQTRA